MRGYKFLGFLFCLTVSFGYSQSPHFTIDPNNKYIQFRETNISSDFKSVAQLKIGAYLTLGNYGEGNGSWIGNNAILTYSSYRDEGSLGNRNMFSPVWSDGKALVMNIHFSDARLTGYTHDWNSSSTALDINDFEKSWGLGSTSSFLLGMLVLV